MTTYRIDRALERGALFFQVAFPTFDPLAPSPINEVWKRALSAGHVDRQDYLRGSCRPDARPTGPIIVLTA